MDGRREPRFQIYAPGKLTLVDTPDRELDCLLLDISATGMKFVMDEGLPVDEVVALEVEDHLVLADVLYSEPRGDKFTIGAERIHAVDKAVLPQEKTRAEQIRFLVDDYRSRIRLAIAGEPAQVKKQEPELPVLHRDQVVEAAVQRLIEHWAKDSESTAPDGTLRAAILGRATVERGGTKAHPACERASGAPMVADASGYSGRDRDDCVYRFGLLVIPA